MAIGTAVGLGMLWAGPAHAGTAIQLGQVGPATQCSAGASFIQAAQTGPPSYTAPSDGRITSWSHLANDSATPGTGRLLVLRPTSGTSYTLVARSAHRAFVTDLLNTFTVDIPVKAGDIIGFRLNSGAPACLLLDTVGGLSAAVAPEEPDLGTSLTFPGADSSGRLNISATLDPDDPPAPAAPTTLDTSATKGKQPVDKLKLKVSSDQTATLDIGGKGKVPKRVALSAAAKAKSFKLKTKTGISLSAGVTKTIGLRFKQNRKAVRQIMKLLKGSKKARKRSKATVKLTVTGTTGAVANSTVKIKLKR